jgi:hypothetical protein
VCGPGGRSGTTTGAVPMDLPSTSTSAPLTSALTSSVPLGLARGLRMAWMVHTCFSLMVTHWLCDLKPFLRTTTWCRPGITFTFMGTVPLLVPST